MVLLVCLCQVERSKALLASLGDERERWESGSETFKSQMATITGDVLLTAAFMAYAGYFDQHFRQSLFTSWAAHLQQASINFRTDLARVEVCGYVYTYLRVHLLFMCVCVFCFVFCVLCCVVCVRVCVFIYILTEHVLIVLCVCVVFLCVFVCCVCVYLWYVMGVVYVRTCIFVSCMC